MSPCCLQRGIVGIPASPLPLASCRLVIRALCAIRSSEPCWVPCARVGRQLGTPALSGARVVQSQMEELWLLTDLPSCAVLPMGCGGGGDVGRASVAHLVMGDGAHWSLCPPPFSSPLYSHYSCCLHCPMLAAVIYSATFHVHELQSGMSPHGCVCSAHGTAQHRLSAQAFSQLTVISCFLPAPFSMQGPPDPMAVAVGQDVVLPCRLSPEQSTQDMEVTWFRDQFTPFVHRYRDGQDQYGDQELRYQGRTEMHLANGSVSLRTVCVQLSDRGSYTAVFVLIWDTTRLRWSCR